MIRFINIHTHKADGKNFSVLNINFLREEEYQLFSSVGIHPWEIEKDQIELQLAELEQHLNGTTKIIAIGECGMDKAINTPIDIQQYVFEKQIDLAEKFGKPLIIHCVRAYNEVLKTHKIKEPQIPWILHAFNANSIIAQQLIDKACYVSFGPMLLRSKKNQEVFKNISLDSVFFETDVSNERIENIYGKAAELKNISIDNITCKIASNLKKVFNIDVNLL